MNHLLEAMKQWLGFPSAGSGDSDAGASVGAAGERLAVAELRKKRYKILGTGVRSPFGEIDIVARDGRTIVFVEVKTRNTTDPFDPLEAVTKAKQQQLTKLALAYLTRHRLLDKPSRFDVVAICWPDQGVPKVQHVVNAFEATGRGQLYT